MNTFELNWQALMPDVARRLLGEPNKALSTRRDWRFGRKGSLTIDIAHGRWFDHETGHGGGVLDLVIRETGLTGREAMTWIGSADHEHILAPEHPEARRGGDDDKKRPILAQKLWAEASPIGGTLAEIYLCGRGLPLPPDPDALRFHPRCPRRGERLPAMLALMTDPRTAEPCGIHRTFLRRDGRGKADSVPQKAMLGPVGVVRLCADDDVTMGLGICEGIETALAVIGRGWLPVWACLSAGGISRFPVLAGIEAFTIFADADGAGLEAARICGRKWVDAGRVARILYPEADGRDWADS